MKTLFVLALLALVLVLVLAPAPAAYAGDASQDSKAIFDEGVKRLEAKDYAGAVAAFERSLSLKESLPALFNLAVAYRGVGRYADAKQSLSKFISMLESAHAAEDALSRANALLEELKKKLARVRITLRGSADSVQLGSMQLPAATTQVVDIDPGKYQVIARKEGYAPDTENVTAVEGELADIVLDPTKKPLGAMLTVTAMPPDAKIMIDGAVVASGRFERALAAGAHRIEIVAADHKTESRDVMVEAGKDLAVDVTLEQDEAPAITERWWFWAGVVAVVAAGTATGIALGSSKRPMYNCGNLQVCLFDD